jgi:disulfide bond formation protein DsbB
MCYWQRYAHMGVLGIAAAIIPVRLAFGPRLLPQWLGPTLLILALLFSAGLAGYHVGVEFGLLEGPRQCAAGTPGTLAPYDLNDPLAVLDGPISGPSCSDVAWRFLGLSMAAWNGVFSLGGALGVAKLGLAAKP